MSTRRSTRSRAPVNYGEGKSTKEEVDEKASDDDDFVAAKTPSDNVRKKRKRHKKEEDKEYKAAADDTTNNLIKHPSEEDNGLDVEPSSSKILDLGPRPRLSESESSSDEEDSVPLKQLKTNNLQAKSVIKSEELLPQNQQKTKVDSALDEIKKEVDHSLNSSNDEINQKFNDCEKKSVVCKNELVESSKQAIKTEPEDAIMSNSITDPVEDDPQSDTVIKNKINKNSKKRRRSDFSDEKPPSKTTNAIKDRVNKVSSSKPNESEGKQPPAKRRAVRKEVAEEKKTIKREGDKKSNKMKKKNTLTEDSESENENWEEVDEMKIEEENKEEEEKIETKDLEISVGVKSIHKKKLTKREKWLKWIKQLLGRYQREYYKLVHKAHVVALLARQLKRNEIVNMPLVRAICLSFVPKSLATQPYRKWDIQHLRKLLNWFQKEVPTVQEIVLYTEKCGLEVVAERQYVLVCILRALGFLTRIVCSMQPCSFKAPSSANKSGQSSTCTTPTEEVSSPYFAETKTSKQSNSKQKSSKQSNSKKYKAVVNEEAKKEKSSKQGISKKGSAGKISGKGVDVWVEVYLQTLKRWICIEITQESINEPKMVESVATKPLQYVVAIDNDGRLKNLSRRYAIEWLSYNRKFVVDETWWITTLAPFAPIDKSIDAQEDAQIKKKLLEKDFPTTISEFKDNPLYALKRHLLKFQAIYPESAVPLGYVRNEPIYSRDCVRELHTRETWMKQARTVKRGEEPYKIVKGRPKKNTPVTERGNVTVEVFGEWQTEVYVPPPVQNGIVPKNEYGNVELFKPCMLPGGAVHLPMTNMVRISQKLKVDYARAMMGWDFHGGWSHPVFEGVVVAKEHEDKLLDAWRREEEEVERKKKVKREKAVYENWKNLIKGLLIHHKLKKKYDFQERDLKKPKVKNAAK